MPKFTSKTQTEDAAIFASSNGEGVHAESTSLAVAAIAGIQLNIKTTSPNAGAGVYGESRGEGPGVIGVNRGGGAGVVGVNKVKLDSGPDGPGGPGGLGGFFESEQKEGIVAVTKSLTNAAIAGFQNNPNGTGAAIYGEHIKGVDGADGTAGFFRGNVIVTGDISFPGADCAEHFTIKEEVLADPGMVMALSETSELVPCIEPYDKKVVGVIAGAGSFRPGIIMDKHEQSNVCRQPIALVGKVFCKVDASYGSIEVGDLLTSSATYGHAMKSSDPTRSFGSVIGKAMAPLGDGLGLIPILISLQ
jgi:hypothetical protein